MPTFRYLKEAQIIERSIPRPTDEVIPGVLWGSPEVLFTPAFWLAQYWMREGYLAPRTHSLGRTLEEEVVACLLGGHGIPAEVAFAAFDRLRTSGLISQRLTHSDVISQKLVAESALHCRCSPHIKRTTRATGLRSRTACVFATHSGHWLQDSFMDRPQLA
jgi:N-glycosylase/DNA lyase